MGSDALRIGSLGFVPPLHRLFDVTFEEFRQVVMAEELVLVRDAREGRVCGDAHTASVFPVRTATTDTCGVPATVMVSSTHAK